MEKRNKHKSIKSSNSCNLRNSKGRLTLQKFLDNLQDQNSANINAKKQITQCVFLGALCLKPVPDIFQVTLQPISFPTQSNTSVLFKNFETTVGGSPINNKGSAQDNIIRVKKPRKNSKQSSTVTTNLSKNLFFDSIGDKKTTNKVLELFNNNSPNKQIDTTSSSSKVTLKLNRKSRNATDVKYKIEIGELLNKSNENSRQVNQLCLRNRPFKGDHISSKDKSTKKKLHQSSSSFKKLQQSVTPLNKLHKNISSEESKVKHSTAMNTVPPLKIKIRNPQYTIELCRNKSKEDKANWKNTKHFSTEKNTVMELKSKSKQIPSLMPVEKSSCTNESSYEIKGHSSSKCSSPIIIDLQSSTNNFIPNLDDQKKGLEVVQKIDETLNLLDMDVDEDDIEDYLEIDQNVVADLEALIPEEEILCISNNLIRAKIQETISMIPDKKENNNNKYEEDASNEPLRKNLTCDENCDKIVIENSDKSQEIIKIDIKDDIEIQNVEHVAKNVVLSDISKEDNKPIDISEVIEVNCNNEKTKVCEQGTENNRVHSEINKLDVGRQLSDRKIKTPPSTSLNEIASKRIKFNEKAPDNYSKNKYSPGKLTIVSQRGENNSKIRMKKKSPKSVKQITDFLSPNSKFENVTNSKKVTQSPNITQRINDAEIEKLILDIPTVLPNPFAKINSVPIETRTLRSSIKQIQSGSDSLMSKKSKTSQFFSAEHSTIDSMEHDISIELEQLNDSSNSTSKIEKNISDSEEVMKKTTENKSCGEQLQEKIQFSETQNNISLKEIETKVTNNEIASGKLLDEEITIITSVDQQSNNSQINHQCVSVENSETNQSIITLEDDIKIDEENDQHVENNIIHEVEKSENSNRTKTRCSPKIEHLKIEDEISLRANTVSLKDELHNSGELEKTVSEQDLEVLTLSINSQPLDEMSEIGRNSTQNKIAEVPKEGAEIIDEFLEDSITKSNVETLNTQTESKKITESDKKIEICDEHAIVKGKTKSYLKTKTKHMNNVLTDKTKPKNQGVKQRRLKEITNATPNEKKNAKAKQTRISDCFKISQSEKTVESEKKKTQEEDKSECHLPDFKLKKGIEIQHSDSNETKCLTQQTSEGKSECVLENEILPQGIKNEIAISGEDDITELSIVKDSENNNVKKSQELGKTSVDCKSRSKLPKKTNSEVIQLISSASTPVKKKKALKVKNNIAKIKNEPKKNKNFTKKGGKKLEERKSKLKIEQTNSVEVLSDENNPLPASGASNLHLNLNSEVKVNDTNILKSLSLTSFTENISKSSLDSITDLHEKDSSTPTTKGGAKLKKNKTKKSRGKQVQNATEVEITKNKKVGRNKKQKQLDKEILKTKSCDEGSNENIYSKKSIVTSEVTNNNVAKEDVDFLQDMEMQTQMEDDLSNSRTTEAEPYKRIYKCNVCLKVLENYNRLKAHKKVHDVKNPYQCQECGESYEDVEKLAAHLRIHKGKMPYPCKKCDASFWTTVQLEKHQLVHVLKKDPPPTKSAPKKIFKCEECGKLFKKICDLERHTRVHTGEKPSVCNICNKRFQQAYNLNKHLLIHTQEKNFECVICQKKFGRNDVLNRHVLTHSIDKPFHCTICSKTFIRNSQLNLHRKKYHGGKNCEVTLDDSLAGKSTD